MARRWRRQTRLYDTSKEREIRPHTYVLGHVTREVTSERQPQEQSIASCSCPTKNHYISSMRIYVLLLTPHTFPSRRTRRNIHSGFAWCPTKPRGGDNRGLGSGSLRAENGDGRHGGFPPGGSGGGVRRQERTDGGWSRPHLLVTYIVLPANESLHNSNRLSFS